VRRGRGRLTAFLWATALALISAGAASPAIAARDGIVRTPAKNWMRQYDAEKQQLLLLHQNRPVLFDLRISPTPPTKAEILALAERLTGEKDFRIIGFWPQTIRDQNEVQLGFSVELKDGRRVMYAAVWRTRPDGALGIAGYMTILGGTTEDKRQDFLKVRGFGNQLARGMLLNNPPSPLTAQPEIIAAANATVPVAAPVVAVPVQNSPLVPAVAVVTTAVPDIVPPSPSLPQTVAPITASSAAAGASALPAAVSTTAATYPFLAKAGGGVSLGQVATVLYAPFESSEIFVLFKDGSFHENLPVALEQWNLGASRSSDPSSWGKWKNASESGEYELHYAEDDIVTISATKIKPAKPGIILEGNYALGRGENEKRGAIRFSENRFEIVRSGQVESGTYRVDGYSVILTHENGNVEHQPFFFVPLDEADAEDTDDEAAIWLGDSLHERID
jgi:hypothetical protein